MNTKDTEIRLKLFSYSSNPHTMFKPDRTYSKELQSFLKKYKYLSIN